jgi:hypothetical protein
MLRCGVGECSFADPGHVLLICRLMFQTLLTEYANRAKKALVKT